MRSSSWRSSGEYSSVGGCMAPRIAALDCGSVTLAAFAAEHEDLATPLAANAAVDLSPEGDEVVHCGVERDEHHEPDGTARDHIDGQHQRDAELVKVEHRPVVGDQRRDHSDDLHDHLEFAPVAGLDGEALRGRDRAQSADQELASDHDYCDPRWH